MFTCLMYKATSWNGLLSPLTGYSVYIVDYRSARS